MTRTAFFNLLGGLLLGFAAGVLYTWVLNPVKYVDVSPDTLRADHKADFVLMIAQAYALDSNLDLARARLATLNLANPGQFVADTAAQQAAGASLDDLRALNALATALGAVPPPLPVKSP
ncbi:MAG: hypothetical protein HYZ49_09120 [Chloroflexi bacterium]|nr:hypothetical protein [Chloroflexota bacterium]